MKVMNCNDIKDDQNDKVMRKDKWNLDILTYCTLSLTL
jgi:hypothetical protein